MIDFTGDLTPYQEQLDAAGVDYDITNLAGCTQREIKSVMGALLSVASRKQTIKKCEG